MPIKMQAGGMPNPKLNKVALFAEMDRSFFVSSGCGSVILGVPALHIPQ